MALSKVFQRIHKSKHGGRTGAVALEGDIDPTPAVGSGQGVKTGVFHIPDVTVPNQGVTDHGGGSARFNIGKKSRQTVQLE